MNQENQLNQNLDNPEQDDHIFTRWWIWLVLLVVIAVLIIVIWWLTAKQPIEQPAGQSSQQPSSLNQLDLSQLKDKQASFWFEPNEIQTQAGQEIDMTMLFETQGANVVVAQAILNYDQNFLEYLSADGSNSALTMDVIARAEDGQLELVRGIPGDGNPLDSDDGFSGQGNFFNLKFKALKIGNTQISFDPQRSKIILDDAKGTAMQASLKDIQITIN